MLVPDIFFSFSIALIISFIVSLFIRKGMPRQGFWLFFLVIFLATWAGGIWGRSLNMPRIFRGWLPFLLSGLTAALIFSWLAPRDLHVGRRAVLDRKKTLAMLEEVERHREVKEATYITVNIFFWVVIILLLAAIILRYV
jgi:hypothetical protein